MNDDARPPPRAARRARAGRSALAAFGGWGAPLLDRRHLAGVFGSLECVPEQRVQRLPGFG